MRRREFITTLLGGTAAAWPFAVCAQQGQMRRVGVLMPADNAEGQSRLTAFVHGLQQFGWTVGQNIRIDERWGDGTADSLRKYATELVALAPEVILANSSATLSPLLQATRTIPIVFAAVADPVGAGYVESLAWPGGNATGSRPSPVPSCRCGVLLPREHEQFGPREFVDGVSQLRRVVLDRIDRTGENQSEVDLRRIRHRAVYSVRTRNI
jgi:hypothetical protein